MAELTSLAAQTREGVGKGANRALRRSGRVPAVVYGDNAPQEMISLEGKELRRALHNPRFFSTLCSLQVNGEAVRVLPRECSCTRSRRSRCTSISCGWAATPR